MAKTDNSARWLCAVAAALLCSLPVSAAEKPGSPASNDLSLSGGLSVSDSLPVPDSLPVRIDGRDYAGEVRLIGGTSYVGLREFAVAVDRAEVRWDPDASSASVETASLTLTVKSGGRILMANGRPLWCASGVFTENGTLYVPLRQISEAFGFRCDYDALSRSVSLTRERAALSPAKSAFDPDEVMWLSRIIEAEAGGEVFEGKLAVGAVVLNRVDSADYPDTIYGVIFDTKNGVQFTPAENGTVWTDPGEESVLAAMICLDGFRYAPDMLYFINEDLAASFWVPAACRYITTVGNHDFYGD